MYFVLSIIGYAPPQQGYNAGVVIVLSFIFIHLLLSFGHKTKFKTYIKVVKQYVKLVEVPPLCGQSSCKQLLLQKLKIGLC